MSIEGQGHFLTLFFSRFCIFCAYTRPRYQSSVYRTIGTLVNPFSRDLIPFVRIINPFSRDLIPLARNLNFKNKTYVCPTDTTVYFGRSVFVADTAVLFGYRIWIGLFVL